MSSFKRVRREKTFPQHRAFGLLDVLLTIGVVVALSAIAIPSYQRYALSTRVDLAAEQLMQAMRNAKTYAQAGKAGKSWGVALVTGILFAGESFLSRASEYDEAYPLPSGTLITPSFAGSEIIFSCGNGLPSVFGSVHVALVNTDAVRDITIDRNGFIALSGEPSGDDQVSLNPLEGVQACVSSALSSSVSSSIASSFFSSHSSSCSSGNPLAADLGGEPCPSSSSTSSLSSVASLSSSATSSQASSALSSLSSSAPTSPPPPPPPPTPPPFPL